MEFVNFADESAVRAALSKPTALLWIATPSNPLLRITDIEAFTALGKASGALVVVDNTFLSPAWQQPLTLGADREAALYRIAQEALHNALRHSGTEEVSVSVCAAAKRVS